MGTPHGSAPAFLPFMECNLQAIGPKNKGKGLCKTPKSASQMDDAGEPASPCSTWDISPRRLADSDGEVEMSQDNLQMDYKKLAIEVAT